MTMNADDEAFPMHEVDVMPGMVIRPGDVLVVACEDHLSMDQIVKLKSQIMESLPGLEDVVIITRPLSIGAVYRRDGGPVL